MLRQGYEVFVHNLDELKEGEERELDIMDCGSCRSKTVKALLYSPPRAEGLSGGEPLWVRGMIGRLLDERPWRIKVTKVVRVPE